MPGRSAPPPHNARCFWARRSIVSPVPLCPLRTMAQVAASACGPSPGVGCERPYAFPRRGYGLARLIEQPGARYGHRGASEPGCRHVCGKTRLANLDAGHPRAQITSSGIAGAVVSCRRRSGVLTRTSTGRRRCQTGRRSHRRVPTAVRGDFLQTLVQRLRHAGIRGQLPPQEQQGIAVVAPDRRPDRIADDRTERIEAWIRP